MVDRQMPPVPEDEFDKDAYLGEFRSTIADYDERLKYVTDEDEKANLTQYRDRIQASLDVEIERLANSAVGG